MYVCMSCSRSVLLFFNVHFVCFSSYSSVFPSYIIDLTTVSDQIAQVNDVQFLHGYNKPTVCVLYETVPTWAG